MNPPTTLTNHNPPATIGCGLNPNPIRREESDTPQPAPHAPTPTQHTRAPTPAPTSPTQAPFTSELPPKSWRVGLGCVG